MGRAGARRGRFFFRAAAGVLAVAMSSHALAACIDEVNRQLCEEALSFTNTSNLWGPANERPRDATTRLIGAGWNVRASPGDVRGVSGFGSFGGRLTAHTHGNFGLYLGIQGLDGGAVEADFVAQHTLLGPPPNRFRPGALVKITFGRVGARSGSNLVATGELNAGSISLWAELNFNATIGGSVCVFDCVSATTPNIGISSLGLGGFPLPPGTSFADGRARQLILQVPVGLGSVLAGPIRDGFGQLPRGDCPERRIAIEEFSAPYNKSGISGCFGFPGFPNSSSVDPLAPTRLVATRTDTFIDADLDLDFWASKIRGIPPFAYSRSIGSGPVSASVTLDALDIDVNSKLSLRQTLTMEAKPRVRLRFPYPIAYSVLRRGAAQPLYSRLADEVILEPDHQVAFIAPADEFDILTTHEIGATLANDTDLIYEVGFVERILEGRFSLPSLLLGFEGFRICKPWPSYSCWTPGIYSPSVSFGIGPLKTFRQPVASFTDSKLFDNNRPPWALPGLPPRSGIPMRFDPGFRPEIFLQGVPTGPINEGDPISITTNGSFDRDGDPFTLRLRVVPGVLSTPPIWGVVAINAPVNQADAQFDFSMPDDGMFTGFVVTNDQGGRRGTFDPFDAEDRQVAVPFSLVVNNLPPVLTLSPIADSFEGSPISMPFSAIDPGVADRVLAWIDWGDGSPVQYRAFEPGGGSYTFDHVYADQGNFQVRLCARDDDGGEACETTTAVIANLPPSIFSVANEQRLTPDLDSGALVLDLSVLVRYSDPGVADSHTAQLVFDSDGSSVALQIDESPFGPPGNVRPLWGRASLELQRTYLGPVTETTQICVVDDDGAQDCEAGPTLLIPESDLQIAVTASPDPARIGEQQTYIYDVSNAGPDAAGNTQVTMTLPNNGSGGSLMSAADAGIDYELRPYDLSLQAPGLAFGDAVAVQGDLLAVGANNRVYLFERVEDAWQPIQPAVVAADSAMGDRFGAALAISADQSLLYVGAPGATPGAESAQGAIYLFQRDEQGTPDDRTDDLWLQVDKLVFSELSAGAGLGSTLALDNGTLVAGAPSDNFGQSGQPGYIESAGSVLAFVPDGAGGWVVDRLREALMHDYGQFGRHIAAAAGRIAASSGTGDILFSGRVSLFEFAGGAWLPTQILDGEDFAGSPGSFALGGVALDEQQLLVATSGHLGSSGYLHVLVDSGSTFTLSQELPLDIANDGGIVLGGERAFVRSITQNDENPAQLLLREAGEWSLSGQFLPSRTEDHFEFGVGGLALDGETLVAGNPDSVRLGQRRGSVHLISPCVEAPAGVLTCGIGTLEAGDARALRVSARVGCALSPGSVIGSSGSVRAAAFDPQPGNNSAEVSTSSVLLGGNSCGVDIDPPRIDPILAGTLGDEAWYVSDVALSWQISEPDSVVSAQTGCEAQTLTSDSADARFTCSATSDGGSSSREVSIRRDAGAPEISPVITGDAGANGWYTSPITVAFACSDAVSGIARCEPELAESYTSEGVAGTLLGTARDRAGNQASASHLVKLDFTPPVLVGERTRANVAGWNNSDVVVSFRCEDATSGIADCPGTQTVSAEGAGQSIVGVATDAAGLSTTLRFDDISIDRTAPLISAVVDPPANANGWHQGPLSITFSCEDALSGVLSCPAPQHLLSEGAGQSVEVSAVDVADNRAQLVVGPLNVDLGAPEISASISPAPGSDGLRALPVTVSFSCSDALSGVAECPAPVVFDQPGLGLSTTVNVVDRAGNVSELSVEGIDAGTQGLQWLIDTVRLDEGSFLEGDLALLALLEPTEGIATLDWGDGAVRRIVLTPHGASGLVNARRAYADNGLYTLSVTVAPDAGEPLRIERVLQVDNLPPEFTELTLVVLGPAARKGNQSLRINAGEVLNTDFGFRDPGSADTHTARIDWGDGTRTLDIQASQSPITDESPGDMVGSVLANHQYSQPGLYQGEVCVRDDDGAETCAPFTVDVGPPVALPAFSCEVTLGTPVVAGGAIRVPLTASAEVSEGEVTDWAWEDADGVFVFDDPRAASTVVSVPLDGSPVYYLGVSAVASLVFDNGQAGYCAATGCAELAPDGTPGACSLRTGIELELDIRRRLPGDARLADAMDAGTELASYEIEVVNAAISDLEGVQLKTAMPVGLGNPLWQCTAPGPSGCQPAAGEGAVDTFFDLAIGTSAVTELSGKIDLGARFMEISAEGVLPPQVPVRIDPSTRRVLLEPISRDAIFRAGFE